MVEISFDKRKEIVFGIMVKIDCICRKHNIPYYLAYGSLLGAVRHGGFIPWDDDIDIWIPAKDYFRFQNICKTETDYAVLSFENDLNYSNSFIKVSDPRTVIVDQNHNSTFRFDRGIAVDVFPLVGLDRPFYRKHTFHFIGKMISLRRYYRKLRMNGNQDKNSKRLLIRVLMFIDIHIHNDEMYWNKKYSKFIRDVHGGAKNLGCTSSIYGLKDIYNSEWFGKGTEIPFCGHKFFCPGNYDKVLRQLYGNYMKLPPEDKRVSNHDSKAFYVESDPEEAGTYTV